MNKKAQYIDWLKYQESALLFHQPWWLDAVYGNSNWDVIFHYDSSNKIQNAFIFGWEVKYGLKLIRPGHLTPYQGPVHPMQEMDFQKIVKQLPSYSECIIPLHPSIVYVQSPKIAFEQKFTHVINLKLGIEKIRSEYTQERKRHIKKASKHLLIKDEPIELDIFVNWHKRSFENKSKKYPYNIDFLHKILEKSRENQSVIEKSAYYDGQLIGMIACFHDQKTMYYILGSFDSNFNNLNSMSLLMDSCIEQAENLGLDTFDFEGSMDEGIAQFFKKFNAKPKQYLVFKGKDSLIWSIKKRILG